MSSHWNNAEGMGDNSQTHGERIRDGSDPLYTTIGEPIAFLKGENRGSYLEGFVLLNWDKETDITRDTGDTHIYPQPLNRRSNDTTTQRSDTATDGDADGVPGVVLFTSYRLLFVSRDNPSMVLCQFPFQTVEKIVKHKAVYEFLLKDFRIVNLRMLEKGRNAEESEAIRKRIYFIFLSRVNLKPNIQVFAHLSKEKSTDREQLRWKGYNAENEFNRMGIPNERVRLTTANKKYALCETYPRTLAVAAYLKDDQLPKLASFRSRKRFPTVSWYCQRTGAAILRSSQPLVGVTRSRNKGDENLLHTLSQHDTLHKPTSSISENEAVDGTDSHLSTPLRRGLAAAKSMDACIGIAGDREEDLSEYESDGLERSASAISTLGDRVSHSAESEVPNFDNTRCDGSSGVGTTNGASSVSLTMGKRNAPVPYVEPYARSRSHTERSAPARLTTPAPVSGISGAGAQESRGDNRAKGRGREHDGRRDIPGTQTHTEAQTQTQGNSHTHSRSHTPDGAKTQTKLGHLLAKARNSLEQSSLSPLSSGKTISSDSQKALYILDARPLVNAGAMTLMGAGYETIDHYKNCKLEFLGIENIHAMRKSMHRLRSLICKSDPDAVWLPDLYSTRWLDHIGQLLRSASRGVQLVSEGHSILVHCSDGWDRTPQITALAMLMMDTHYRTINGFITLIEKEWLSFGHKFNDRCLLGPSSDRKEFSPVFLQFIDCTWQILQQYPHAFEFNEAMLLLLLDNVYACRYGTFLGNCDKWRSDNDIHSTTPCLWDRVCADRQLYVNVAYKPPKSDCHSNAHMYTPPLRPTNSQRFLRLWPEYYHRYYYLLPTSECDVAKPTKPKLTSKGARGKQRRPLSPYSPQPQRSSLASMLEHRLQLDNPLQSLPSDFNTDAEGDTIETDSGDSADEDEDDGIYSASVSRQNSANLALGEDGMGKGLDAPFPSHISEAPVKWMPDDQVTNCSLCQKKFSAVRRKHHCRRCGHIFCYTCAHYRRQLTHISSKPVRVCNNCFVETTG